MQFAKTDVRRVAIIDDDPFWQYQLRHNLKAVDQNLEIRVLANAEEFLNLSASAFDLVISDQDLGFGRSGLSVFEDMQRSHPEIPFALTTGAGQNNFNELTEGMSARPVLIEKPYRFQSFKAQIESMMVAKGAPTVEKDVDWSALFSAMMFLSAVTAVATVIVQMEGFQELHPSAPSAPILRQIAKNVQDHQNAYVNEETRARMLKILARAEKINQGK